MQRCVAGFELIRARSQRDNLPATEGLRQVTDHGPRGVLALGDDGRTTSGTSFPKSGDGFRADVEGLRGIAVLLVVGCHCGISWCAGGFVGVDMFFVISGYLITGLLAKRMPRNLPASTLLDFSHRRARRLLPACAAVPPPQRC